MKERKKVKKKERQTESGKESKKVRKIEENK